MKATVLAALAALVLSTQAQAAMNGATCSLSAREGVYSVWIFDGNGARDIGSFGNIWDSVVYLNDLVKADVCEIGSSTDTCQIYAVNSKEFRVYRGPILVDTFDKVATAANVKRALVRYGACRE